jgi:thiamine-phosphate pyrophosphorylase
MSDADKPQLYLITPPDLEMATFPDRLAACLDVAYISCVRLRLATTDEARIAKAADALREIAHARDVAIVIDSHIQMVERLGLDGVHLKDGSRSIKATRKELGADAIIGTFCGNSAHDGMTAGELGADYVSFGPAGLTSLGNGAIAPFDLFEWWSQMIEVPQVAEGALDVDLIRQLTPYTDFFGIGDEIWAQEDATAALKTLIAAMN